MIWNATLSSSWKGEYPSVDSNKPLSLIKKEVATVRKRFDPGSKSLVLRTTYHADGKGGVVSRPNCTTQ